MAIQDFLKNFAAKQVVKPNLLAEMLRQNQPEEPDWKDQLAQLAMPRKINSGVSVGSGKLYDPMYAPINPIGPTEESFNGTRILTSPVSSTPMADHHDPQMAYRMIQNLQKTPIAQAMQALRNGGTEEVAEARSIPGSLIPAMQQEEDTGDSEIAQGVGKLLGSGLMALGGAKGSQENESDARGSLTKRGGLNDTSNVDRSSNEGITRDVSGNKYDQLYNDIQRRLNKDFKGADRDKDHNWKDALRSAGLAAASALQNARPGEDISTTIGRAIGGGLTGAIGGSVDRNFDEKLGNEMKLKELIPKYQAQYGMERQRTQDALNDAYNRARTETIKRDDERQRDDQIRKQLDSDRKYDISTKTLDWKKEDRERYYELENQKLEALKRKDQKNYDLAVKRQEELERHNKVNEGQAAANEAGRNRRAQAMEQGRTDRSQAQRGMMVARDKSQVAKTIAAIRAGGGDQADIDAYINTLPVELRP